MPDLSKFLPFLGVLVLALVLDYWLIFRSKLWHKPRNGEFMGKAAMRNRRTWQLMDVLTSGLLKQLEHLQTQLKALVIKGNPVESANTASGWFEANASGPRDFWSQISDLRGNYRAPSQWLILRQSHILGILSVFGGTILITSGLFLFVAKTDLGKGWVPWALLITGLLLYIWKLPVVTPYKELEPAASPLSSGVTTARIWQRICLLASPFLAALAVMQAGDSAKMNSPTLAVAAWLTGIVLAMLGSWQFSARQRHLRFDKMVLSFGFLVGAAFIIRSVDVTHIPPVLTGDEGSMGLNALRFLNGESNNIFTVGWGSFPALFFYLQSISISLFGQTIAALRLPSALIGGLTVGFTFLLARKMFGRQTAWFASIFLCAYNFHNHFSRLGLNNIWDGLWFTVVLGAVWEGWQKEKQNIWILAGLALGFSQYFYVTSRLLIFIILAFLAIVALRDRRRFIRVLPQIMSMLLVAMVVFLPLAIFFLKHPDEFMAPFNRVSVMGHWMQVAVASTGLSPWQILAQQLNLSFEALFRVPLNFWYDANVPLLRPFSAALFFLGIATLIARYRDARFVLLGIWIVTFIFTGALSESVPAAQRYLAIAPALSICVGYGLFAILRRLNDLWPGLLRLSFVIGLLVICLVGIDELNFYFFKYTPNSDLGGFNTRVAQSLADYLENKNENLSVLLFGSPNLWYRSISSLPYLLPDVEGLDMVAQWGSPENPLPQSDHIIFVFLPNHEQDLRQVRASLPGGKLIEELGPKYELLFWLYEVSQ